MTLAKFNRFDPSQRAVFRKLRYNKRYSLGRQFVEEVCICSLNSADNSIPEEDGFYHIVSSARFGSKQLDDLDLVSLFYVFFSLVSENFIFKF